MNKLVRYIGSHVIMAIVMVVAVVCGLEFFINFIGQYSYLGKHDYGFFQATAYVGLQIPQMIYNVFPMIGFLGSLLGLGKLSSGSELIVMRAAGFSKVRIIISVIIASCFMLLIMTAIGEVVAPRASQVADQLRNSALQIKPTTASSSSWLKHSNTIAYIGKNESDTDIADVTVFQFASNHRLREILHAKSGKLIGGAWQLYDIAESRYLPNRVETTTRSTLPLGLYYSPQMQSFTKKGSMTQSTWQLWHDIHYLQTIGLMSREFQFQFWVRLLQPVSSLLMILLGVPFVFGSLRHSGVGTKVLVGVIVGFGFYMLSQLFGPISLIMNFPPLLAAATPSLLFATIYIAMMKRVQ